VERAVGRDWPKALLSLVVPDLQWNQMFQPIEMKAIPHEWIP